jgi:hypothetical protein
MPRVAPSVASTTPRSPVNGMGPSSASFAAAGSFVAAPEPSRGVAQGLHCLPAGHAKFVWRDRQTALPQHPAAGSREGQISGFLPRLEHVQLVDDESGPADADASSASTRSAYQLRHMARSCPMPDARSTAFTLSRCDRDRRAWPHAVRHRQRRSPLVPRRGGRLRSRL